MTMELFNTLPLPAGTGPDTGDSFDLLGYYTFNRGRTNYSATTWGHEPNQWQDFLVPDRMVRVYQGYGANYSVKPEDDPNLVLTGVWLIDDVTYTADGVITVEGRDVGRLLTDQIMFPPVVPLAKYPLTFEQIRNVPNKPVTTGSWNYKRPAYRTSSAPAGQEAQYGHLPQHAFDAQSSGLSYTQQSYWLSVGRTKPDLPDGFEWVEGALTGETLAAVKVAVRGGGYKIYVSVYTDKAKGGAKTGWVGTTIVPYRPTASRDHGGKIPYVGTAQIGYAGEGVITFPAIRGVTRVRITGPVNFNGGHKVNPYRFGVRDIQVSGPGPVTIDGGTHEEGDYRDYSEIVKRLLAYGGWWWPQNAQQVLTDGNARTYTFPNRDRFLSDVPGGKLPGGRLWADIHPSGTSGPAPLGVAIWDKKPLMDGINYVKDILGFIFFIDEVGGAVFRLPNVYALGNWLIDSDGYSGLQRTAEIPEYYDDQMILGLRAKLSSRNLREHVFVANTDGKTGATGKGRIPHPVGFRRVGGWTDQNFASTNEAQIMADLITLRQLFTWRQDALRIPANPALQIDDQIRIIERTTGDAYVHYVRGISSTWDLESGQWIYDVTTNWLGADPQAEWAFRTTDLAKVTQDYLKAINQGPGGVSYGPVAPATPSVPPTIGAKEVDMIILHEPGKATQWLCDAKTKRALGPLERNALVAAGVPYLNRADQAAGITEALAKRTTVT